MYRFNHWREFLRMNYDSFAVTNLKYYVDKFNQEEVIPIITNSALESNKNYDDYALFCLDGWSSEAHYHIVKFLETRYVSKFNHLGPKSKVLFFNEAEGYCTDEIFYTIHFVVKVHKLNPKNVVYRNLSANNEEMYNLYCDKNDIPYEDRILLDQSFYFNNINAPVYKKNEVYNEILPFEQKKLFINLNWNKWNHRLVAIALWHYYDLIDDGYITSPCKNKFKYDVDLDFGVLLEGADQLLDDHPMKIEVIEKLQSLKPKYPLMIDDRSKYNDSNEGIYGPEIKVPVFTARKNSHFEVVSETYVHGPIMFTEKSYWPIMESTPFFQLNSRNSLKQLHKAGYKTFSPYIDESYDEETNPVDKIIKIAKELQRFKKLKQENIVEFTNLYNKLQDIAKYNAEVFSHTTFRKC